MQKVYINSVYVSSYSNTIKDMEMYYSYDIIYKYLNDLISVPEYGIAKYTGKILLVKPNWVTHNNKANDALCMTTHPNFILALLQILVECKPKEIILGDAPIQGCRWDELVTESFVQSVDAISQKSCVPIRIVDFRRTVLSRSSNTVDRNRRDISNYVIFDLAENSYLEPITIKKSMFRVTDYDPDRLASSHHKGKHLYCIAKELFEADYVIALPKAKTHQKAGITNALKLIVGFNGDKDFLPHHRVGGTGYGGDCYPGRKVLRRVSEFFLDNANRHIGKPIYKPLKIASKLLWKISFPQKVHNLAAGWYGNDTTWRMVMDLNTIVKYGKKNGSISSKQQRSILYICDGIIAGQGDGPLNPDPLPLGVVMISDNAAQMDLALTVQMGLNLEMIPLVKESLKLETDECEFYYNGKLVTIKEIGERYSLNAEPPPGWMPLGNNLETV